MYISAYTHTQYCYQYRHYIPSCVCPGKVEQEQAQSISSSIATGIFWQYWSLNSGALAC
jgi:hypothetical protein